MRRDLPCGTQASTGLTQALAAASLTVLQQIRGGARSLSDLKLLELQRLAAKNSDVKYLIRQRGLVLELSPLRAK